MRTIAQKRLRAGDLVYCRDAGRAWFARNSVEIGEEVEMIETGKFIMSVASKVTGSEIDAKVYLSPLGVPTLEQTDEPIGKISSIVNAEESLVTIDLNA